MVYLLAPSINGGVIYCGLVEIMLLLCVIIISSLKENPGSDDAWLGYGWMYFPCAAAVNVVNVIYQALMCSGEFPLHVGAVDRHKHLIVLGIL